MEAGSEDRYEFSMDGASSCLSMDAVSSDLLGDGAVSFSLTHGEDVGSSSSGGSSPLGWPLGKRGRRSVDPSPSSSNLTNGRDTYKWEHKMEIRETDLAEVEMMKEKFAKLLLGEDMSGGAKGVCTAMAISNAITNLSASIFGQLWKLEPFPAERRTVWRREMEWLLSVSDHIVELVPTLQTFPDGSTSEVMVSRPRSDLQLNLPALQKLENMLLNSLDIYRETEFWYVDRGIAVAEKINQVDSKDSVQRQEEKWWLPTPKVPVSGLSEASRKLLHHQRDATSQILKAAMAINSQVLSEMEIPHIYLNSLPKNGRSSLGDVLYRTISSDNFSAEGFLSTLDTSDEHSILDLANRLETTVLVWGQQTHLRHSQVWAKGMKSNAKASWGKDVGYSILESYSRVLESLAFNIIARIDDVQYADDLAIRALSPAIAPERDCNTESHPCHDRSDGAFNTQLTAVSTPYDTPSVSPSASPPSPNVITDAPRDSLRRPGSLFSSFSKVISEYTGYGGNLESTSNALHCPPAGHE
ncbi:hypothetical protein BDL97_04G137100 [Sphagnum fallax]|nr:hypothetical protein BDL97_04G137100 [Sphagnum fallax]KAH8965830.1 hypothetical protein BDL97_04G137100 [Sphagnum fallax]